MMILTNFDFQNNQVRVLVIENEPWFVAKDICDILEHSDVSMACKRLKDYEKGTNIICTPGGKQDLLCISESGLYRLMMTSRKPQAEPFQDWVCQEVLPAIRKTGKYESHPQPKPVQLPPADIRLNNFVNNLEKLDIDLHNPRFKQHIQDLVMDKIIGCTPAQLPPSEVWLGVAEKAEDMGYPVLLVTRFRSQLGKFVAAYDGLESKKEKRMCNGTQRMINLYKDGDELENAVKEFMDAKVLAS